MLGKILDLSSSICVQAEVTLHPAYGLLLPVCACVHVVLQASFDVRVVSDAEDSTCMGTQEFIKPM